MTRQRFCLALLATGFLVWGINSRADFLVKEDTVQGTVIRVGDSKLTLVESSSNAIERFKVASDASISRDGRNVKLEEIAFGDFALVAAKSNDNARIATVIVAVSPFKR